MIYIGINENSEITAERDGYCVEIVVKDPAIKCTIYLSWSHIKAVEKILNLMYDIKAEKTMPGSVDLETELKYAIQEMESAEIITTLAREEEWEEEN